MPLGKSPILLNDLMAEGDNNKHLLFNDALIKLEDAANRVLGLDFSAGDIALTDTQITSYGVFRCTGNTVLRTLTIPLVLGVAMTPTNRVFAVRNTGTSAVTVTHGSGATVTLPADTTGLLYANGTEIISLGGVSNNATIAVADEGVSVATVLSALNFVGNGVTASMVGSTVVVTITDTDAFLGLTDTPSDYTGQGGKLVSVKSDVSGLEFVTPPVTGVLVRDEGTDVLDPAVVLNFEGDGVTVTDTGSGEATVTIPGKVIAVEDEGTEIVADALRLNFTGAGVTVTDSGSGEVQIAVTAGGSTIIVQDEGGTLTSAVSKMNFVGAGVTVTQPVTDEVVITIAGNTVLYGTAAPTTEGVDGDFYIRTTTNFIYGPKAAGTWPAGTSLVGPTGATGAAGATGSTGAAGATGATGAAGVNADMTRTSTTSVTVGTGSKTFGYTTSTNLGWVVGTRLRAVSGGTNVMEGAITSVSSTSVTISVDYTAGSGTLTSWNISVAGERGTAGAAGTNGTNFPAFSINTQTGNYTAVNGDFVGNRLVRMNVASANTFTVNAGITGTEPVSIANAGVGQTTIVAGAGVTINSSNGLKLRAQYSVATLIPIGTDSYLLSGDIAT